MRLITRSDFDGLACGALLKEAGIIDCWKFAHPKDIQDGLVEVTKNGSVVITAYQTKDGYESMTASFYFSVRKSNLTSWILVIVGIVGFIVLYFVLKFVLTKIIQKTSPNSAKKNQKGKLD